MVKTKDLSEFSASAPEFKLPPILHCRQNFERGDDTLRAVMDGINGLRAPKMMNGLAAYTAIGKKETIAKLYFIWRVIIFCTYFVIRNEKTFINIDGSYRKGSDKTQTQKI